MSKRHRSSRSLGRRISDLQSLLFPLLGFVFRTWWRLIKRTVSYDRRGPLFDYIKEGKPCIVAMWHQDVFQLMFDLFKETPSYPCYFMVSPGRVGTIGGYIKEGKP